MNNSSDVQEAAPPAPPPVKPRESEAQKQLRLNNEIKENVTKILLDVTDTLFGWSLCSLSLASSFPPSCTLRFLGATARACCWLARLD